MFLVVIDNLYIFWAVRRGRPGKPEALLFVGPNAILPVPVPGERFQPVAGKLGQVAQAGGGFQNPQPLFRLLPEGFKLWYPLPFGEALRFFVLVAMDYLLVYQESMLYVQRKHSRSCFLGSDSFYP